MKKALLVIDMQNDYLYEKRKAKFSYDTENLVNSVNSLIEKYHGENSDVIYTPYYSESSYEPTAIWLFYSRNRRCGNILWYQNCIGTLL